MYCKKIVALILCITLLCMVAPMYPVHAEVYSEPKMGYVDSVQTGVCVRTGTGTNYNPLVYKGNPIYLYRGNYVQVKGVSGDWCQIAFNYFGHEFEGYMYSEYVKTFELDDDFESYLNEQGFPESYKPYLRALHAAFGDKWTFKAYKTGLDWNTVIDNEAVLGKSLIDGGDTTLRSTLVGAYDSTTGVWKQYESGWYAASRATVAFYMDPRNYLIDGTCFAFENLSMANSAITVDDIKKVFEGYAWATDQIAEEFIQAGKEANVSSLFLASRAKMELGRNETTNASGYDLNKDGKLYYNFFNIGAYGDDPNLAGIQYASKEGGSYGRPWDSSYKAILGGAQFLVESYFGMGQNSLYLQKFNVTKENTYWHQYMTNIRAPYNEGWISYEAYRKLGRNNESFTFEIPVYDNMPDVTLQPTTEDPPEVISYAYVETLKLKLNDDYVSGIVEDTKADSIINSIKSINADAKVTIRDKNGNEITDSPIGTGATICIADKSGTMNYTFVLYGDVNGDGHVGATDLLYVKRHILDIKELSGPYAQAATLANNQIGATSLLAIKRHILGVKEISQK